MSLLFNMPLANRLISCPHILLTNGLRYILIVIFVGVILVLVVCACLMLRCTRNKRRGSHTLVTDVASNPTFFLGGGNAGDRMQVDPSVVVGDDFSGPPDVVRMWRVGETTVTRVMRGPGGLGTKLEERNNGRVYLVGTSKGSPSEQTFGSTRYLGVLGLRVVKVRLFNDTSFDTRFCVVFVCRW